MKRMLLAVLSAFYFCASAQITITNAVFPAAGDTLEYSTDPNPDPLINAATPPGGPQVWDFSLLQAAQNSETIFQPASAGMHAMDYPGADLVVIGQTGGETYFNVTNTKFEAMGFAGVSPMAFGLSLTAKYLPSIIERRAPLNFFDINAQTSSLTLPFSADQLPDTLFSGLPIQPDSIRFRLTTTRTDVVDGWGTCKIPGASYPVLREKRTEYTSTGLDVKVPFLGWLDLGALLGGSGGGLGGLIGTDTTLSYRFLSGIEKEEIAVVTMNSAQNAAQSVRFKANATTPIHNLFAPGSATINAFPNPAVEWVRFDCTNLPNDWYTLKIFNVVGKVVWKESYQLSGNKSFRIELESFKKGTYLYSLVDSKGNIVGTKRLVVLKP